MKKILTLITLASLALMVAFSGCKKDEDEDMTLTWPTATITGKVWADLNTANDTTSSGWYEHKPEYAPTTVKIIAVYNTVDLVDDAGDNYTYQDKTVEATVASDGTYTLTIPARGNDVNVTLKAHDFTYDQIVMDNYPATTTQRVVFSTADQNTTVVAGDNKVIDFWY